MRTAAGLRLPLVHFLALGALLFLASDLFAARRAGPPDDGLFAIVLDPERIETRVQQFRQQARRAPSASEREGLIDAAIEEEILFREANRRGLAERDGGVRTRMIQKMLFLDGAADLEDAPELLRRAEALGLQEGDIVVRRILVQKMRLLAGSLREDEHPTDEEIAAEYAARLEDFRRPERRDLRHVFFSLDDRGTQAARDAAAELQRIEREAIAPADALEIGDPFPLGHDWARRTETDLGRTLGETFAKKAFAQPEGRWSAPIESAYGFHLVLTEGIEPGEVPPLEAVRDPIRSRLARARSARKLDAALADWRARYTVTLPGPPRKNES